MRPPPLRRLNSIFIQPITPARRFREKFSRFRRRCRTVRRRSRAGRHTREFMSAAAARPSVRRIVSTKTCTTRSAAEAVSIVCESDFRPVIHGQTNRACFSANAMTATKVFRSAAARIIYTAFCRELRSFPAVNDFLRNLSFSLSRIILSGLFLPEKLFENSIIPFEFSRIFRD